MSTPQPRSSSRISTENRPKSQALAQGKQNTIYRSRSSSKPVNVYDMYSNTVNNRSATPGQPATGKEYVKKFKSVPTRPPKHVSLDHKQVTPRDPQLARNIEGFFPSVRLSHSPRLDTAQTVHTTSKRLETAASYGGEKNFYETNKGFEISPSQEMTRQYYLPKSAREDVKVTKSVELNDICARRYPYFTQTYPNLIVNTGTNLIGGDLSLLPRPKNFVARRNLPWVYRYKIKKNMNELSKIMASKPPKIAAVD